MCLWRAAGTKSTPQLAVPLPAIVPPARHKLAAGGVQAPASAWPWAPMAAPLHGLLQARAPRKHGLRQHSNAPTLVPSSTRATSALVSLAAVGAAAHAHVPAAAARMPQQRQLARAHRLTGWSAGPWARHVARPRVQVAVISLSKRRQLCVCFPLARWLCQQRARDARCVVG